MTDFTTASIERLVAAWSIPVVEDRGLPPITEEYLRGSFAWSRAEQATRALTAHFASARFADEVEYGALLVPDPSKLDTRAPLPRQLTAPDVFDERLPAGVTGSSSTARTPGPG